MRNTNQMFVVTVFLINEILYKIFGFYLLERIPSESFAYRRKSFAYSFDKPPLYLFKNKKITLFLSQEKKAEGVRHL